MAEHEATQSVWKRPVSDKTVLVLFAVFAGIWAAGTTMTSSWTRTSSILMAAVAISIVVRVFMRRRQSAA